MKRLFVATALLTVVAAGAQAGSLPKPIRLVDKMKTFSSTHYLRGSQRIGGGGGDSSMAAEARTSAPAPAKTPKEKPVPQPARAD